MASWHEYYQLVGSTAATLLGLLFVSMSLNAETILGENHRNSRRLAEQAFQNYLAVLFVSLMVFFPHVSPSGFAQAVLWISGIWGGLTVVRFVQVIFHPPVGYPEWNTLRRYLPSIAGFALLIIAGVEMLVAKQDESTTCAIAVMMMLLSATILSWDLLVQIAAEKYGSKHKAKHN